MPYPDNIVYTAHAVEQMDKRGISQFIVERAIANGEVIEEYDTSEERRYLLHWDDDYAEFMMPYHVVAADKSDGRTIVITAYDPRSQADRWSDDFKTRLD